ncbi:MAG: universal stress protein [Alphaproteobacteria bacterium]
MKKILVATDFSERSDRAIRRATLLARQFDAPLTIAHVVDDDQPKRAIVAKQQAAQELLDAYVHSLRDVDGLACETRIAFGDPFLGIIQAAREENADLTIIGPHRRQILKDVFIGTTAERTIRASDRPILMANGVPAGPYRHVLLAVDLSDSSGEAVRAVQEHRFADAVDLSVIHIFDAPALGFMLRTASAEDQIKDYLADEEERAASELSIFLKKFDMESARPILKHKASTVAHTICSVAREISADLIVVGTHGLTGIKKTLLGSVAEELLRISDRDVLAISSALPS